MKKAYACIWSNKSAAEMVQFYKSVFKGTKVGPFAYWGKNPMGVKEGSVLTAGKGQAVQCGWVIDKFGVHWQITPSAFDNALSA